MQLAQVIGQAVATVKHPSMTGWKLLVVQSLAADGKADGEPLLAIDALGAGQGHRVMISNDGAGARQVMNQKNSPVRWMVLGILDQ
jgi:ethanolamine utilization protein EutN